MCILSSVPNVHFIYITSEFIVHALKCQQHILKFWSLNDYMAKLMVVLAV